MHFQISWVLGGGDAWFHARSISVCSATPVNGPHLWVSQWRWPKHGHAHLITYPPCSPSQVKKHAILFHIYFFFFPLQLSEHIELKCIYAGKFYYFWTLIQRSNKVLQKKTVDSSVTQCMGHVLEILPTLCRNSIKDPDHICMVWDENTILLLLSTLFPSPLQETSLGICV